MYYIKITNINYKDLKKFLINTKYNYYKIF